MSADTIITHVNVSLSRMDRLRVLIRGRLRVSIEVETERLPGEVSSTSRVEVPRVFPGRDRGGGHHEAEPQSRDEFVNGVIVMAAHDYFPGGGHFRIKNRSIDKDDRCSATVTRFNESADERETYQIEVEISTTKVLRVF